MKCPDPMIISMSSNTKCLFIDTQRVCTSVLSTPRYGQTLNAEVKSIQSTTNLPRYYSQYTPAKVHNNTSSFFHSILLLRHK